MRKVLSMIFILVMLTACQKNDKSELIELADQTPPWIQVESYEFATTVGNPINLETASAYDETDGPCEVVIVGTVNFNKSGEYYLKYVAKDLSGNVEEEPFTVIVNEENEKTPLPSKSDDINKNMGCDKNNAMDSQVPCNKMMTDVTNVQRIFQGKEGYDACVVYGNEQKEMEIIKSYQCQKLMRNDNKLWGYGITVKE